MKSSWLVVQPVSPVSSNSFPTSSTAKSLTRASTLTTMVLQSTLPSFFMEKYVGDFIFDDEEYVD
jgi:hypothetical protein